MSKQLTVSKAVTGIFVTITILVLLVAAIFVTEHATDNAIYRHYIMPIDSAYQVPSGYKILYNEAKKEYIVQREGEYDEWPSLRYYLSFEIRDSYTFGIYSSIKHAARFSDVIQAKSAIKEYHRQTAQKEKENIYIQIN